MQRVVEVVDLGGGQHAGVGRLDLFVRRVRLFDRKRTGKNKSGAKSGGPGGNGGPGERRKSRAGVGLRQGPRPT